jgi:hypothetical protein
MPCKTDPPLVIDSNAVLALPISGELFDPISRRNAQILQRLRVVQYRELPTCDVLDAPKPWTALSLKERFGVLAPERLYHPETLLRVT